MSSNSASHAHSRSLIGSGTRIVGHVAFTGTLQTDGEITGDIACKDEGQGTVVVGRSGRVTGAVNARQVIVGGTVSGDVSATDVLEVHDAAHIDGDLTYRGLVVHPGGIIEGHMQSAAGTAPAAAPQRPAQATTTPTTTAPRTRRPLFLAAILTVGVASLSYFAWPGSPPTVTLPPPVATSVADSPPPSPPVAAPQPAEPTAVVAIEPPPQAATPTPPTLAQATPPTVAPAAPRASTEHPLAVRGDSADKPADLVYVVAHEASVLFKKRRLEEGNGNRIELPAGAKRRIMIAADDLLRVTEGEKLEMFFQGRRVMPVTFRGGAWLEFVPAAESGH